MKVLGKLAVILISALIMIQTNSQSKNLTHKLMRLLDIMLTYMLAVTPKLIYHDQNKNKLKLILSAAFVVMVVAINATTLVSTSYSAEEANNAESALEGSGLFLERSAAGLALNEWEFVSRTNDDIVQGGIAVQSAA